MEGVHRNECPYQFACSIASCQYFIILLPKTLFVIYFLFCVCPMNDVWRAAQKVEFIDTGSAQPLQTSFSTSVVLNLKMFVPTRSDNKFRELATVFLPWQQWTENSVWFDGVGISAFHSCLVWCLSVSFWVAFIIVSVCFGVPSSTTHRSCITTIHLLTRHCLWGSFQLVNK
jgi:hypothetical protein